MIDKMNAKQSGGIDKSFNNFVETASNAREDLR